MISAYPSYRVVLIALAPNAVTRELRRLREEEAFVADGSWTTLSAAHDELFSMLSPSPACG
jgi:hypothetical protein